MKSKNHLPTKTAFSPPKVCQVIMHISILVTLLFAASVHAEVYSSYSLSSYAIGKRFDFEITAERILKTPEWRVNVDSPPLAARKADQLATTKFQQLIPDAKDWKRERVVLVDARDGLHWFYVVKFWQMGTFNGVPPFMKVIVLMDGTVVEPRIRELKQSA